MTSESICWCGFAVVAATDGKRDEEHASFANGRVARERAAHRLDAIRGDGEAEARAGDAELSVGAKELVEDGRTILVGDSEAVVADTERTPSVLSGRRSNLDEALALLRIAVLDAV